MNPQFLPFALPDITEAERGAVDEVLRSGWITTGTRTREFETAFATRVGAPHAVAVNSCTAALHLALEAIGVGPSDEVIVPTLTFAASAEVVRYLGARPILVDVRAADHAIDVGAIERAVTPRTRAVLPVHFAGQICDMDPILQLAEAKKLCVVEDAAHAFPVTYRGRSVGTLGDITCFSFYATKTLTTAEGGMITTERDDWAERMRIMSLHGISKDAWKRYSSEGSWFYEIIAPGFKYNMTDVAAAMGLVQLQRADEMRARRRDIARRYDEAFGGDAALELLSVRDAHEHAWHLYVIKLVREALTISRNDVILELKSRGIGTSVHFIPLHIHPYYRDTFGYRPDDLPVSLDCFERSISLPIYSKMSDAEVDRVIDSVLDVLTTHRR